MEGRPIIREANLEQFRKHPGFAKSMDMEKPPEVKPLYPNPLEELKKHGTHQWECRSTSICASVARPV